MATEVKTSKAQDREVPTGATSATSTVQLAEGVQIVQVQRPELQQPIKTREEILRERLGTVLTDIVTKAQEVAFELATIECSQASACPLAKKCRELIMALKKLFEMRKELET